MFGEHYFLLWYILTAFARVAFAHGTEAAETPDFECSNDILYSDVQGIYIRCSAFPAIESKYPTCFKDLWWKYVAYNYWDQSTIDNVNVFNLLDVKACKKSCKCVLTLDFGLFDCIDRGRPPRWIDELTSATQRTTCKCRALQAPDDIKRNLEHHIELEVSFRRFPVQLQSRPARLDDLLYALDKMGIGGLEIFVYSGTLLPTDPLPPLTSLTDFFTPGRFPELVSLIVKTDDTRRNIWDDAQSSIKNITNNKLLFFAIYGPNFTSMPKPAFITTIKSLICHDCVGLVEAPKWLGEASNLLFVHISGVPSTFPLADMPPSKSLLHFSIARTNLKTLPENFVISRLYPNLENLDLCNLNLSVVPENLAQNLSNLRRLDLSGNSLIPLPSFKRLAQLNLLRLDGLASYTYGPEPETGIDGAKCPSNPAKSITIKEDDLRDLVNLETLSLSYYRSNVEIDEKAFANLGRLRRFTMDCANVTRLPEALKYTCNIQRISANKNPFTTSDMSNPQTWPMLPLFIPKYYKKLDEFTFRSSTMKSLSPSLWLLNVSSSQRLLQTVSQSIQPNGPIGPINPCEQYKLETAYRLLPSLSINGTNSGSQCLKEYTIMMQMARDAMANLTNFCIQPISNKGVNVASSLVLVILALPFFVVLPVDI